MGILYAGLSDRGRLREANEDQWFADPTQGLFLVSDGLGGEAGGAIASQIVATRLPQMLRESVSNDERLSKPGIIDRLRATLSNLSDHVRQQHESGVQPAGRATVVLALVHDIEAIIAHMGDSRAYLLRSGQFERLTHDHSVSQLLVEAGDITIEQAASHPGHGVLTRCVGMAGEPLPETRLLTLHNGDRLLLCSDGLTNMLEDQAICSLLSAQGSPEEICRRLIDAANQRGGEDNITAIVLFFQRLTA